MSQRFTAPTHWTYDVSILIVRVIVGVIFALHGAQSLFGLFGSEGIQGFVDQIGPIAYLVKIGEFLGGIGIVLGFLCRFSAASNIVIMIGAIVMVHGKNGFFLQQGGFEYNLALIGLLAPILIAGPGRVTLGRMLPLPGTSKHGRPILPLE